MDRLNYIYIVRRLDGAPLYVGKGSGQRLGRHAARARSNPHYAAVLKQAGSLPVEIIAEGLTEIEAFKLEECLTRSIGIESEGGPLVNCGHGGRGGPVGAKKSEKWRQNRRVKAFEVWRNEAYREKMLRPDRNRSGNKKPRTDEFKKAMSERLKGNKYTLGFKHSESSKEKMKNRWADPIWKEKEMIRRKESGMYSKEAVQRRWKVRKSSVYQASEKSWID